ncbi:uracil-DNA glycosylase [Pontitalea aquivivens]|uniref:uracil-DNA glycosylase n=1 Tax=Pontitalea aquivivens TaxID=3388663 RepID=UPI003970F033
MDYLAALAALEWQLEMGADEAILDAPLNRYDLPDSAPAAAARPQTASNPQATAAAMPVAPAQAAPDPVALARAAAGAATDLPALARAIADFDLCDLKKGARSMVFADGNPAARVMIIGEAPGREEDLAGKPFVGPAGQLLDRMFAAIGLSRGAPDPGAAFYITNVLPWRPPGNRTPDAAEIDMMRPFLARHVELADPDFLVLMGNPACQAALGRTGIVKLRGQWAEAFGRPALPMTHPAYLLRMPLAKRDAWADLLGLRARLDAV